MALLALILTTPAGEFIRGEVLGARTVRLDDTYNYLPADTNLVFTVRMDQLLANAGFKKLRKEVPEIDKNFESGFRSEFGLEVGNVEQMTVGGPVKGQPTALFRLMKPVKVESLLKAASQARFPGEKDHTFKEEKVGTFTMYVPDQEYRSAFCLQNNKTLLSGRVKELKPVLERTKKPELSPGLHAALRSADTRATILMAFDPKSMLQGETMPMVPGVDWNKGLDAVRGGRLTIELGENVVVRAVGVCKDDRAASETRDGAVTLQQFLKTQVEKAPPGTLPKEILGLPAKVKLSTKDNLVEATLTATVEEGVAFFKAIVFRGLAGATEVKPIEKKPIEKKP